MDGWRFALASVAGTSHLTSGIPCQDASACQIVMAGNGAAIFVAVVADGAGSASHADEGAVLACEQFLNTISDAFALSATVADLDEALVIAGIEAVRSAVQERAAGAGKTARDYACTLLGAIVGPEEALFCQVGDGAIVVGDASGEEYDWVFWPQAGEYANHTYFVTDDDAAAHLAIRTVAARIDEIALFSDGLQRLALHFATQRAHDPFFRPLFGAVRPTAPGLASELSATLAAYLASERVNARTEDDKTLILATRWALAAEQVGGADEAADAGV